MGTISKQLADSIVFQNSKIVEWDFWKGQPKTKTMVIRIRDRLTMRCRSFLLHHGEHALYEALYWSNDGKDKLLDVLSQ